MTELKSSNFKECYKHLQESMQIAADIDQNSIDYREQLKTLQLNIQEEKIHIMLEAELQRVNSSLR